MHDLPKLILALGRVEGKLDSFIIIQQSQARTIADITKRVSALEQQKAWLMGIAATLSTIISALWGLLNHG